MIASWMLHGLVVGALLSGAGALAERALRMGRASARFVWPVVLAATLALPAYAARRPAVAPALAMEALPISSTTSAPMAPRASLFPSLRLPPVPTRFDVPLAALWLVLSGAVASGTAIGLSRLARARRGWRATLVDGREVLVSDRFGPAVMGFIRPEIVMPRWALDLERADRALVFAHEDEHRRARDPLLLAAGALAVAVAPWSPFVWWQARRLRAAVELDCDARVLRRGAEPIAYGELLLRVGSRNGQGGHGVLAAALTETTGSILERRLTMITREAGARWKGGAAAALVAAAALGVLACETPTPTTVDATTAQARRQELAGERINGARVRDGDGPPIIFIDGVEHVDAPGVPVDPVIGSRLSDVDPNDIERIEVIKPPASVNLFGERAKGGVIQIFLKKTPSEAELIEVEKADGRDADVGHPVEEPAKALIRLRDIADPGVVFMVDGREVPKADFNPSELQIERIDVLAERAAAAFREGATKVVRITTKK